MNVDVGRIEKLIRKFSKTVSELDEVCKAVEPKRHFTLDGHLVGSIGEVVAQYYYDITLEQSSVAKYDAHHNSKKVQIKTTQRSSVTLQHGDGYLIVLHMSAEGVFSEVYNGLASYPWKEIEENKSKRISLRKLAKLNKCCGKELIDYLHVIPIWKLQ